SMSLLNTPMITNVDPSRLHQVITNLVTNAINYTGEGGTVSVMLEEMTHQSQRYAVIHVEDTGVGIPKKLQADIFKPFFRVSDFNTGVGLGLSITKEIVELHGGYITLESEEGVGTRFSVWLPLADSSPDAAADEE
ncbi:MAG: sensor histidine kinase, partial [Phototrophicaceae bacterium]